LVTATFGTGQVLWSMVYFFLFFIWIWLLISIFGDIFRSDDLGGWGKGLWSLFVIVTPFLGVFVYLIARGKLMTEHAQNAAHAQDVAARAYIRESVSAGSASDELSRLADLKSQGVISEAEFQQMKSKVIAA
jgi:hypothetical protein